MEQGAFAFISYSHKNKWALYRLHTHLAMLKREGLIHAWCDRDILAGDEIDQETSEKLESCELFLALVSPDFIESDYCYEREMTRALERHDAGEARVIPIIIEPCDWINTPLKKGRNIKALPRDAEPVSKWENKDEAFLDVVTELRRILNTTSTSHQGRRVDKIRIPSSPIFADEIVIDFEKLTLITGGNSVGKTALCEWFATVAHTQYLERWSYDLNGRKRLSIEVYYRDPKPHMASVSILANKRPEYKLDGTPTTIPTTPLKIIFPQDIRFNYYNGERNDLDLISKALNLHPYELQALCDDIDPNGSNFIKRIWFEEHDEDCSMFAEIEVNDNSSGTRLGALLAETELDQLKTELGILAANELAVMYPTVLILDSSSAQLNADWLRRYKDMLVSPTCKFQTIISRSSHKVQFSDLTGIGCKIIELKGTPPNVIIRTGTREEDSQ